MSVSNKEYEKRITYKMIENFGNPPEEKLSACLYTFLINDYIYKKNNLDGLLNAVLLKEDIKTVYSDINNNDNNYDMSNWDNITELIIKPSINGINSSNSCSIQIIDWELIMTNDKNSTVIGYGFTYMRQTEVNQDNNLDQEETSATLIRNNDDMKFIKEMIDKLANNIEFLNSIIQETKDGVDEVKKKQYENKSYEELLNLAQSTIDRLENELKIKNEIADQDKLSSNYRNEHGKGSFLKKLFSTNRGY